MEVKEIIERLQSNSDVFKTLLFYKTKSEFLWRPSPEKWCLLEIVCHLLDEEIEDFRARTNHILETPLKDMNSINPKGWVLERQYIAQDYNKKLDLFLKERGKSIVWLKGLTEANWKNTFKHDILGHMSAKLFLANWLAHDYLHMRQILRYQYLYLKEKSNIDLAYAGNW
jgi:hypothetical protein